jgi:hypothetical protein
MSTTILPAAMPAATPFALNRTVFLSSIKTALLLRARHDMEQTS